MDGKDEERTWQQEPMEGKSSQGVAHASLTPLPSAASVGAVAEPRAPPCPPAPWSHSRSGRRYTHTCPEKSTCVGGTIK